MSLLEMMDCADAPSNRSVWVRVGIFWARKVRTKPRTNIFVAKREKIGNSKCEHEASWVDLVNKDPEQTLGIQWRDISMFLALDKHTTRPKIPCLEGMPQFGWIKSDLGIYGLSFVRGKADTRGGRRAQLTDASSGRKHYCLAKRLYDDEECCRVRWGLI